MEIKEWEAWRASPSTKEFFKYLVRQREHGKEELASGVFSADWGEKFALTTAHSIGGLENLEKIIKLEREDLDDEYVGDIPPGIQGSG